MQPCLIDAETEAPLPQKLVAFDVDVVQGYADVKITQVYENTSEHPLQIIFRFPRTIKGFAINKLTARFLSRSGKETMVETQVMERKEAEEKFEDAVAKEQTVVMPQHKLTKIVLAGLMTIRLGNFPPESSLILTAQCS